MPDEWAVCSLVSLPSLPLQQHTLLHWEARGMVLGAGARFAGPTTHDVGSGTPEAPEASTDPFPLEILASLDAFVLVAEVLRYHRRHHVRHRMWGLDQLFEKPQINVFSFCSRLFCIVLDS